MTLTHLARKVGASTLPPPHTHMADSTSSEHRRSPAPESKNTPQWRVTPSSDGRGEPAEGKPPWITRDRRWWAAFGALLVLNLVLAFSVGDSAARAKVPYQPFFVAQLQSGNVASVNSLEDTIDGELNRPVRYDPPGDAQPVDVTRFKTQVPAFIERAELTLLVTSDFGQAELLIADGLRSARRQLDALGACVTCAA